MRYLIPSGVVTEVQHDGSLRLQTKAGNVVTLNGYLSTLWRGLQNGMPLNDISGNIVSSQPVEPETMDLEVSEALKQLVLLGFLNDSEESA